MARVAFIGLGNMGGGMAANLAKKGHDVRAFDLSADALEKARAAGCLPVESAAAACDGAEAVVTMLPAGTHVESVYADSVFDHADPDAPVEVVNLRLAIRAGAAPLATPRLEAAVGPPLSEPIRIFLDGGWQEVALYRRAGLRAGHRLAGPAVVAQDDTTLLLPAGAEALVQPHGHMMVTL